MIPLSRLLDANFPTDFTGQQRIDWELELLQNQRKIVRKEIKKHKFKSSRWSKAKEQLIAESNGKCAYCEAPFTTVAYGDVEHYRPKSKYWWLAYAYFNYLPSCQLCNQRFKKAKFPIKNRKLKAPRITKRTSNRTLKRLAGKLSPDPVKEDNGMPISDFFLSFLKERPYCINPYIDDPDDFFEYEFDDVLREVFIIAKDSNSIKFVEAAEKVYGLNRKELRTLRYKILYHYRIHREVVESTTSPRLKLLNKMGMDLLKKANSPFAGMIRYFDRQDDLVAIPLEAMDLLTDRGEVIR